MGMDFYKKEAVDGERNPWVGAGIGAGGGGLLAAALGYIYGHRGKWLAYDTLTGGLAGGAAGYAIEQSNKNRIEGNQKKEEESATPELLTYQDRPTGEELSYSREFRKMRRDAQESLRRNPGFFKKIIAYFNGDLAHENSIAASNDEETYKELRELGLSPEIARTTQKGVSAVKASPINPYMAAIRAMTYWDAGDGRNSTQVEDDKLSSASTILDKAARRVRPMTTGEMYKRDMANARKDREWRFSPEGKHARFLKLKYDKKAQQALRDKLFGKQE